MGTDVGSSGPLTGTKVSIAQSTRYLAEGSRYYADHLDFDTLDDFGNYSRYWRYSTATLVMSRRPLSMPRPWRSH